MGKIIDISYYQGNIDWTKARTELDLIICRATCGMGTDKKYLEYTANCGLPFGAYCYVTAGTADAARKQARYFVEQANKAVRRPNFYIADIEADAQNAQTTEPVCVAFLDELRAQGCAKIGLYINTHYKWAGKAIGMCDIIWIPHWGKNDGGVPEKRFAPKEYCDIWQYTSEGRIDGIKTNVDLDMLYGDKPLSYFTDESAAGHRTLRNGMSGDDVKALQEKLNKLGYDCGKADGIFGAKTEAAVMAFQADHSLTVDGIVGPKTWAALDAANPEPTYTVTIHGVHQAEMEAMKTRWPDCIVSKE